MAIVFKRLVYQDAIPTKVSELENDSNYLTHYTESDPTVPSHVKGITESDIVNWNNKSTFNGDYNNLINKPTIPTVPTSNTQLTNDAGFITNAVNDLINYYKKTETYSQEEINNLLSSIPKFKIEVVSELPTTNISTSTVYLKLISNESSNLYEEYIYVNNTWEKLGTQTVDLTGYAKEESIPTKVSELENDSGFLTQHQSLEEYAKKNEIPSKTSQLTNDSNYLTHYTESDPTVPSHVKGITESDIVNWNNKSTFNGDYNNLINKPTIPTVPTSNTQLTNDAGFITNAVNDLVNYYKKSETYSQSEINNLIKELEDELKSILANLKLAEEESF